MTAVESVIPVFVKSDLKQAMCSSIFLVGPLNLISFISTHASPVWSNTVAQKTAPMFAYYIETHVLLNADII